MTLWQSGVDAETGKPYYFNVETGESSWDKPPELARADAQRERERKAEAFRAEREREKKWQDALVEKQKAVAQNGVEEARKRMAVYNSVLRGTGSANHDPELLSNAEKSVRLLEEQRKKKEEELKKADERLAERRRKAELDRRQEEEYKNFVIEQGKKAQLEAKLRSDQYKENRSRGVVPEAEQKAREVSLAERQRLKEEYDRMQAAKAKAQKDEKDYLKTFEAARKQRVEQSQLKMRALQEARLRVKEGAAYRPSPASQDIPEEMISQALESLNQVDKSRDERDAENVKLRQQYDKIRKLQEDQKVAIKVRQAKAMELSVARRQQRTITTGGSLPEGWSEATDEDTGDTYYYNSVTGVTQWDRPATIFAVTASSVETVIVADAEPLSAPGTDDADSWEVHVEAVSGKKYFYNNKTGETQWEEPAVLSARRSLISDTSERSYLGSSGSNLFASEMSSPSSQTQRLLHVVSPVSGTEAAARLSESTTTSRCSSSNSCWEEHVDAESGDAYFHNKETGETSWEIPQDLQTQLRQRSRTTSGRRNSSGSLIETRERNTSEPQSVSAWAVGGLFSQENSSRSSGASTSVPALSTAQVEQAWKIANSEQGRAAASIGYEQARKMEATPSVRELRNRFSAVNV